MNVAARCSSGGFQPPQTGLMTNVTLMLNSVLGSSMEPKNALAMDGGLWRLEATTTGGRG